MNIRRRLFILGILVVVSTMVLATQYAITRVGYQYTIAHPSESNIRFIGSDNSTGGRLLRVDGANSSNATLKLYFGNWSANTNVIYSAAFGIVNEEDVPVKIKYINASSSNHTYLKIWLHGDRDANANSTATDPTSVLMFNNGTIVNATNTVAWTIAPGNGSSYDMCSNISDRANYSVATTWDETAHVRYSLNDSVAYSVGVNGRTSSNASDFVWVQVAIEIPLNVDGNGVHSGTIYIHFEADTA